MESSYGKSFVETQWQVMVRRGYSRFYQIFQGLSLRQKNRVLPYHKTFIQKGWNPIQCKRSRYKRTSCKLLWNITNYHYQQLLLFTSSNQRFCAYVLETDRYLCRSIILQAPWRNQTMLFETFPKTPKEFQQHFLCKSVK